MRFGVLGPLVLLTSRGVDITARREQCILAMLLLHPNRELPVPVLAEAVWADDPPPSVRGQIHDCVSRLRRRLAAAGIAPEVIRTTNTGYRITVEPHDLDSLRFDGLTRQARSAVQEGRADRARQLLEEALALWRGPALLGVASDRVRRLAAGLDRRRQTVRLEYARLLLATGRPDDAATELTEMVDELPYHEAAHHSLMLALHRAGRSAEALDVYQRLRARLREELGVDPDAELQDLHRRILRRSSTAPSWEVRQTRWATVVRSSGSLHRRRPPGRPSR